ncbi:MAG: hypothetical protein ACYCZF_13790 [Anaerolineae bacterium]
MNENDSQPLPEISMPNVDESLSEAGEGLAGSSFEIETFLRDIFDTHAGLFFRALNQNHSNVSDYWTARIVTLPGNPAPMKICSRDPKRKKVRINYAGGDAMTPLYFSPANATINTTGTNSGASAFAPMPVGVSGANNLFEFDLNNTGEIWVINTTAISIDLAILEEFYSQEATK